MLWSKLFTAYAVLQNDGHGETNTANVQEHSRQVPFRSQVCSRLGHILKNLHDNYTAKFGV